MRRSGRTIRAAIRITFWRFPFEYARTFFDRVELEAVDQLVPIAEVDPTMHTSEQCQRFGTGERGPEARLTGHEGQPSMRRDGLVPAVETEDLTPPARGLAEPEKKAEGSCLACTIGAEVTDHLTLLHLEIEVVESNRVTVTLGQSLGPYGQLCHSHLPPLFSWSIYGYRCPLAPVRDGSPGLAPIETPARSFRSRLSFRGDVSLIVTTKSK